MHENQILDPIFHQVLDPCLNTPENIINLVHTCFRTYNAKRGSRQFSVFMSENICALVDLFDKAVAEGARPNTMKTRSEPCDET